MPRIRSIKPEFFDDYEFVSALPRDLRLYYVALWVRCCDDRGCFPDVAPWIAKETFPYDADITPAVIDEWNKRLIELGRLVPYEVGGKRYLCVWHFLDHQQINRPSKSTLHPIPPHWTFDEAKWRWVERPLDVQDGFKPDAEGCHENAGDNRGALTEDSVSAHGALPLGSGSGSGSGSGVGVGGGEGSPEPGHPPQPEAPELDVEVLPAHTAAELRTLQVLRSIPGYPFDFAIDLDHIRTLAVDYPSLDLLEEAKRFRDYYRGKRSTKKANWRLRLRNWCAKAVEIQRERSNARASPYYRARDEDALDRRLREVGLA